ncbi:MAG: hypothetical protein Q8N55_02535 [bacterium]|nr:hypothetical protein [bacterium]
MKNKKGELTSKEIVTLVMVGLAVVIFVIFYSFYPWGGTINKETCHQSIIFRSTFNAGPFEPGRELIPLKCQTDKICLTADGSCKEFEGVDKLEKTKIEVSKERDILDAFANALYDCHSMLGEGNLNFMPHHFWSTKYGLMCARIAFKGDVLDAGKEVTYKELYEYMLIKKTPDAKSYLEYLYGIQSKEDLDKFLTILFTEVKKTASEQASPGEKALWADMTIDDWKIDVSEGKEYAIVATMKTEGYGKWVLAGGGLILSAGLLSFVTIPIVGLDMVIAAGIVSVMTPVAATAGGLVLITKHPNNNYEYMHPTIYPYEAGALQALNINDFAFAP